MKISAPLAANPIVDKDGRMTQAFSLFSLMVADLGILTGTGTPEGSVIARQTQLYMDETGGAGAVLYIKRDTDIGGDPSKGWILI